MTILDCVSCNPKEKKRVLGYKPDGNTVCHHYRMAYPYKEFWLVEFTGTYGMNLFDFSIPVGKNLVPVFRLAPLDDVERLYKVSALFAGMSEDMYFKYLDRKVDSFEWIKNAEIQALRENGQGLLAEFYQVYHDEMEDERDAVDRAMRETWAIERKAEQIAQRKQEEQEFSEFLEDLKAAIEHGGSVHNTSGLLVKACDKYGVNIPIRTRGFMLDSLVQVNFDGKSISYSYRKKVGSKSKGSRAIYDVLFTLADKIRG